MPTKKCPQLFKEKGSHKPDLVCIGKARKDKKVCQIRVRNKDELKERNPDCYT